MCISMYLCILTVLTFFHPFFLFGVRPGVDIKSKSEHTGCSVEGSADTRPKESEEAVAGRFSFTCSLSLHKSKQTHC